MRLQVNLIPAIAYALVTMFAHTAGWTREEEKTPNQTHQQSLSLRENVCISWTSKVYNSWEGPIIYPGNFLNLLPGPKGIPSLGDREWPNHLPGILCLRRPQQQEPAAEAEGACQIGVAGENQL